MFRPMPDAPGVMVVVSGSCTEHLDRSMPAEAAPVKRGHGMPAGPSIRPFPGRAHRAMERRVRLSLGFPVALSLAAVFIGP